jgi:pSer/pThr/pTyr-binding forkhead associated (FHA) protein
MVGRAPNCDCVLPEECVSRRHAQLWREGERWFLRDLGSRNGTRVNGMRVIESVEVRPGDRLSLGGAAYRLRSRGVPG